MQYFFIYLLRQAIRIITNTTAVIISKTGCIIIKAITKNNAINNRISPIAAIPDQSPLHAADIEPMINSNINANKCILSTSFLKHTFLMSSH